MADELTTPSKGWGVDKIVALFGLFTTIFVVVTAYVGRIYLSTYYAALNIPTDLISISVRDYATIGTPVILLYCLILLITSILTIGAALLGAYLANTTVLIRWLWIGVFISLACLLWYIVNFSWFIFLIELTIWIMIYAFPNKLNWVKALSRYTIKPSHISNKDTIQLLLNLGGLVIGLILTIVSLLLFVILLEGFAKSSATNRAAKDIPLLQTAVRLDALTPLPLPVAFTTGVSTTAYTYSNLYYLASSGNRLFLFTCRENETTIGSVIWLQEDQGFTVSIESQRSVPPLCTAIPPAISPSPTPTASLPPTAHPSATATP